jgi:hypothetical protein
MKFTLPPSRAIRDALECGFGLLLTASVFGVMALAVFSPALIEAVSLLAELLARVLDASH